MHVAPEQEKKNRKGYAVKHKSHHDQRDPIGESSDTLHSKVVCAMPYQT